MSMPEHTIAKGCIAEARDFRYNVRTNSSDADSDRYDLARGKFILGPFRSPMRLSIGFGALQLTHEW